MNGQTAEPKGPIWVGGELTVITEDEEGQSYSVMWLPDKNNDKLREANEPMIFYYLLDRSRIAKDADGHYKFHLQKFSGVMDDDKNIGDTGYAEIAGGYLNFTTTSKIPEEVMVKLKEKFKDKIEGQYNNHPLLKFVRNDMPEPNFRPAPITESLTKLHKISRDKNSSEDSEESNQNNNEDIPAWGWDLEGEGKGSLNPVGTNAFSAMLGQFPVQLIEGAAESGESNITIENHVTYNVWAPVASVEIEGDWEAVFTHLSAAYSGGAFFTKADLQGEIENMEKEGAIEVKVEYNEAFVGDEEADKYENAADEIAEQFISIAEESILQKETPDVESASANGSRWFPSRKFSMKAQYNKESLSLNYSKKIDKKIERKSVQRTTLTGLFDELKENEEARKRYFSNVYLEEGFQKVHVVATCNANWESEENEGDPINQVQLEVGYPDSNGNIVWKSTARYRDEPVDGELSDNGAPAMWTESTKDRIYVFDFSKREEGELEDRDPEEIEVRETISFKENPRVIVEETTRKKKTTDHNLEVRAETAGHLSVGPILLDRPLGNDQITVHVKVRADGVPDKTFKFTNENENKESRYFDAWYESQEEIPPYEYLVEVIVKGKNFTQKPLRWEGEWKENTGSGPLEVAIPNPPSDIQEKLDDYLS